MELEEELAEELELELVDMESGDTTLVDMELLVDYKIDHLEPIKIHVFIDIGF